MHGQVSTSGLQTTVLFEYGTTDTYGQTKDGPAPNIFTQNPGPSNVYSTITGLTENTTYHYRLKAVGSCQTTYGSDATFTTLHEGQSGVVFNPNLTYGSVKDIDGNSYKTILIGTQTWMAENLRTITFNDNNSIPLFMGDWNQNSTLNPVYNWYNSDPRYKNTIGAFYNWYAVASNKLCPIGWHIPTDDEWTALTNYLGGDVVAGNKLKEVGDYHWWSNNTATNESGFTALPGWRYTDGLVSQSFAFLSFWWTGTESDINYAWNRVLSYGISRNDEGFKRYGYSVRCVKN